MDFMLYHHLGMGDHIIHHGLVRRLYEQKTFTKFKLITKKHYADNVRFMYSDLENPMFDLMKVIENALDSHTMYSAFMTLIDCMGPRFSKLYIHESYIGKIYPTWPNDKKLINYWNKRNVQII